MSNTEFYVDATGQHRFRVKAGNGEIIASSEGYTTIQSAHAGLEALARVLFPDAVAAAWEEGVVAGWKPDSIGYRMHRAKRTNPYLESDCTCRHEDIYGGGFHLVRTERIPDEECPVHQGAEER